VRTWHRFAPAALQVFLLLYLLLLSPKISLLIALLLYAGHFIFVMRIKAVRKVFFLLASLSIMVLSYFTIPFFNQRIHEVVRLLSSDPGNAIDNSMVFRRVILQTDLNLLQQSWLKGMGPARLQQNLDMAYLYLSGVTGVPVSSYNTHNEYLNQWICFGLAGLLYFLFIFYIHLKRSIGKSQDGKPDLIYLSCCLMIMISCMTENLFSRQHGVLFAALLLNLFYFEKRVSFSGRTVSAAV
jgi:O-antigen ligase